MDEEVGYLLIMNIIFITEFLRRSVFVHFTGVFSCSHLIRYIIVKLYQIFSNIQYSPQV